MLILLPPSETKRPGGSGGPLRVDELAFSALAPQREAVIAALEELSQDPEAAARTLKLSARQLGEIQTNAAVTTSSTMPAIDRFTGVLFDALDGENLDESARAWLGERVAIQTALLGPVGALDLIPGFRLSAGHRLPGLPPLKRHWADPTAGLLASRGPVLDMRSEAYRALGAVPGDTEQAYVRVVNAEGRALNHFNKQTKGVFTRALALSGESFESIGALVDWARETGFTLAHEGEEILLAEAAPIPASEIFAIEGATR